jgi:hypothetical protein
VFHLESGGPENRPTAITVTTRVESVAQSLLMRPFFGSVSFIKEYVDTTPLLLRCGSTPTLDE